MMKKTLALVALFAVVGTNFMAMEDVVPVDQDFVVDHAFAATEVPAETVTDGVDPLAEAAAQE